MPMAMATRNDSFITENGSSRARVRRTRRGPRLSPSAGLLAEVGLAGLRLAPREAEPRPEPSVPVSVGVSSSAAGSFDVGSDCVVLAADEETRSEEHTSELQSRGQLVCRRLLEKDT